MNRPLLGVIIFGLLFLSTACGDAASVALLPEAEAARLAVIMTATAEAQRTAEQRDIAAGYASATATTESYYMEVARINATATAEAIAREDERRAVEATATAVAFYPTATAIAQAAVERDIELERQRMALAEEQRLTAQKARQDEMLLPIVTYGPWVGGTILTVVLLYGLMRLIVILELRARAIKRDDRGDAPLMLLPNGRNGMVIYDGDRAFGPVMRMDQGEVSMPALVDDMQQATVTMRDQAIDLATRHLPHNDRETNKRQRAVAQRLAMTGAPPVVRVIDAQAVSGWLHDVTPQALTMAMRDEVLE